MRPRFAARATNADWDHVPPRRTRERPVSGAPDGDVGSEATCEGGFGFTRLGILDPSPKSHQSMASADGRAILVFNGEFYDAFEHRAELEASGCRFRSSKDTEVVLHLHRHEGWEGMLECLNGMFAIGLVDLDERCLLLSRERRREGPLSPRGRPRTPRLRRDDRRPPRHSVPLPGRRVRHHRARGRPLPLRSGLAAGRRGRRSGGDVRGGGRPSPDAGVRRRTGGRSAPRPAFETAPRGSWYPRQDSNLEPRD